MSQISEHIGERIKLYRKNKQLTQEQFAQMIHKSKSAVSKYECGEISIDIDTLCEIAEVLEITIHQLLDRSLENPLPPSDAQGFFSAPAQFYVYYLNKNSTRIVCGVLEINRADDRHDSTILFADLKNYENLYSCQHLYFGDIHYSDSYVNMVMKNQANSAERIFFILANPFQNNAALTVGILSGISAKYLVPISLKVILSKNRLCEDEVLREALRFTRDDFHLMKKTYCFSVDRLVEL